MAEFQRKVDKNPKKKESKKKRNLFLNIKGEHLSSCGRVSCDKNHVDAPSHRCVLVCCEVRRGPPAPFASLSRKL